MCVGISLAWSSLPRETIGQYGLERRVHERGGEPEIHFYYRDRTPELPIWRDGQLQVVRWGNGRGQSRFLPRSGWAWQESIDDGTWRNIDSVLVDIPAMLGLEGGVWFTIREGIRGLLVPDEHDVAVVYMVCEPASHYYRVMTHSPRMPVLIRQRI
jgi:hypothetical protein